MRDSDGPVEPTGPLRPRTVVIVLVAATTFVLVSIAGPVVALLAAPRKTQERWSLIGQALEVVGTLYAGLAFVGVGVTLFLQRRQLSHQQQQIQAVMDEQSRNSEIALRQLHVDLVKMAIDDPELEEVWPPLMPGVAETRKDHYCNLILNMQKVAYEAGTIDEPELRGMARYLMASPDMYDFWTKARALRVQITGGDEGEDFLTSLIDEAYENAEPPSRAHLQRRRSKLRHARRRSRATFPH